jgi:hypothetical protein
MLPKPVETSSLMFDVQSLYSGYGSFGRILISADEIK